MIFKCLISKLQQELLYYCKSIFFFNIALFFLCIQQPAFAKDSPEPIFLNLNYIDTEESVPKDSNKNFNEIRRVINITPESFSSGNYATGNWFSLRDKLENNGLKPQITYINSNYQKIYGGLSKENELHAQGLLSVSLEADTQKLHLWKGGTAYLRYRNSVGPNIDANYIGDFQYVNAFAIAPLSQLTDYWYKQSIFSDRLSLKAGKQTANYDFVVVGPAVKFQNYAFYSSSTTPLPAFPATALGVSGALRLNKKVNLRAGWFKPTQLRFDSTNINNKSLNIVEIDLNPTIKDKSGSYIYGMWLDTSETAEISNTPTTEPKIYNQNYGLYSAFEQMIYKENKDKNDDQGLRVVGQFGWAPSDRNFATNTYAIGLTYHGLINKRVNDFTGIGTGVAVFSKNLKIKNETAIETFYLYQATPWLFVQPDFQIVFNPSGIYKNAYIFGIRIGVNL